MKSKYFYLVCVFFFIEKIYAQSVIKINIVKPDSASIIFLNDKKASPFEKLDFSKGDAELILANATGSNQYKIMFEAGEAKQTFTIPGARIPKEAHNIPGETTFKIAPNRSIDDVVGGLIDSILKITIQDSSTPAKTLLSFTSKAATDTKVDEEKPAIRSTAVRDSKGKIQSALRQYVEDQIDQNGYKYIGSQNIIIDNGGIIHIYLDQNLSPVYSYFPTTAKDGYDKFQFHILSTKEFSYSIESNGKFDPTPISGDIDAGRFPKIQSSGSTEVFEFPSAIFGPFSGNFPFFIQRYTDDKPDDVFLERSIKLLKVSRVSLDMGLVSSWLRNPENITAYVMPTGETTLVADNPDARGMLVAMLTFHVKPRNLNIPPRTIEERIGFSVGLPINKSLGSNFLLGLNFEVTNGLFLNGGVHFGEINYPINYKDFKYGEQIFTGTLITKKRWDAHGYLAVSIDAALFVKAFKSLFTEQSAGTP